MSDAGTKPDTGYYVTLVDKTSGNRRTERVATCKTFAEAETKFTHDGRFNYDPKHEVIIGITKGDYIL